MNDKVDWVKKKKKNIQSINKKMYLYAISLPCKELVSRGFAMFY